MKLFILHFSWLCIDCNINMHSSLDHFTRGFFCYHNSAF